MYVVMDILINPDRDVVIPVGDRSFDLTELAQGLLRSVQERAEQVRPVFERAGVALVKRVRSIPLHNVRQNHIVGIQ